MWAYEDVEKTAAAVRAARGQLKLSQSQLGKALGRSKNHVATVEAGGDTVEMRNPHYRAELLERIAELGATRNVLGLPPEFSLRVQPAEGRAAGEAEGLEVALRAVRQVEAEKRLRQSEDPPRTDE